MWGLGQSPNKSTDEYPRRQKAITMLFWRIELAAVESGTPAIYDALINELNEWMISYRLLVKSRITRTANRKVSDETGSDKKEAVAMSAQTSATAWRIALFRSEKASYACYRGFFLFAPVCDLNETKSVLFLRMDNVLRLIDDFNWLV